jgi:predicted SnoaL-like aldol condensation-catalyzing enzyme
VRVFDDGEYVVAHSDYDFFGPKVGFDIFRFQDGRIVEHWDNLQDKPSTPSPSGHTMLDGSATVADLEKTDENKRLVRGFFEEVMLTGKMDRLTTYFEGTATFSTRPQWRTA